MEHGAEFSCENEGFPATLKDPEVYDKSSWNREFFATGRSWVDDSVGIGPGKELAMLSKGINTKCGITGQEILFLHLKDVLALQC